MFKNINNYRNKIILLSVMWALLLIAVFTWSVLTGQYPLTLKGLLSGDTMSIMVFKRLRLPRAIMGIIGGFGLSISGYVYQMIFKNPLASPDVVGVSSGASAGAAFAIVAVSSLTPVVSISAFAGGIIHITCGLSCSRQKQLHNCTCWYCHSFCSTDNSYVSQTCCRS